MTSVLLTVISIAQYTLPVRITYVYIRVVVMRKLATVLCFLVPLQLVLVDETYGACQVENHAIYVRYYTTAPANVVQPIPSLLCNQSSVSSASGDGDFALDVDDDTSASCCVCGDGVLLCETLDDAFSSLVHDNPSQDGLFAYIAMNETVDSSAYRLLDPHKVNGDWGEIAIGGFGDVSIECASRAGLVLNEFSTVIIDGTSWKGCGDELSGGGAFHSNQLQRYSA